MYNLNDLQTLCPICSCGQSSTIRENIRNSEGQKIQKCQSCELVFICPMPDEPALEKYYSEQYRIEYDGNTIEERFSADLEEAKTRCHRLGKLLSPGLKILEIGSGSGAFLKSSSDQGANVTGIEYDEIAQEWISNNLGLNVFRSLDSIPADQSFELIVMFHVLEHVTDPIKFVTHVTEWLAQDGALVIEVPNIDDALLSIYGLESFAKYYFSAAHLTYFSPKTLAKVTSAANLVGDIECVQRYGFKNHINWINTGAPGGINPASANFSSALQELYNRDLIALKKADTIWAIFTKEQK